LPSAIQCTVNVLRNAEILDSDTVYWLVANSISFLLVLTAHWAHRMRLGLPTTRWIFWSWYGGMVLVIY